MDKRTNWSNLNTVKDFDHGIITKRRKNQAVRKRDNMALPTANSLFVESLIEQLCKLIENDPKQQQKAYKLICSKLADMCIIDKTYSIDELSSIRLHYQKVFTSLVPANPLNYHIPSLEESRYKCDYEELSFIAAGGFGRVYKARHKLDNALYAIKKILLKPNHVKRFYTSFEEVKTLAKLNHPNIVQYKSAWIEPYVIKISALPSTVPTPQVSSASTDDIVFEHSKPNEGTTAATTTTATTASEDSEESDKLAVCEFRNNERNSPISNFGAMLYVSMQLCDASLSQWLKIRNSSKQPVDLTTCISVLMQTSAGLEYIHSQHIVHHDIKPNNIFVSHDLKYIQVGDFGLSCCLKGHANTMFVPECDVVEGIGGTKLYMAPEQLRGQCHSKSDMFSLGLVLIELNTLFSTEMERVDVLKKARLNHFPETLSDGLLPLAQQLLSIDTSNRPSASELLVKLERLTTRRLSISRTKHLSITEEDITDDADSDITCFNNSGVDLQLKQKDDIIKSLREEVELLRKLLSDKDKEINKLKYSTLNK